MKFDNATQTVNGNETRNVRFNAIGGCYIGQVRDPLRENNWTSASWNKRGHCRNQTRSALNLVLPNASA